MKKTVYSRCAALTAAVVVAMAAFTACEKEEDSAVLLETFGPTPVLRGETIRFVGSNLSKVTAVVFPENIEVAPAVVSSGEITAVIPQDAVNGFVTLRYPGGSITTKSRIVYADDVVLDTVRGATDPVRAGDTITIAGDNLTGVTQVVFSVDVAVESRDFITQSRYEITLALPNNAQTGDVYLLAGAAESRHVNLNVDGPSITSVSPPSPKPGRDTLRITGANLDLAVSVIFAGDITVDAVPVSAGEVKAAVPADALNGAIKIVSTAGLEYASANEITLLAPANITHTATRYKAGSEVTISGNDLDLVRGVAFSGDVNVEFDYNPANGSITVTIPETATSGAITLRSVAGEVTTPDVTLVAPTDIGVAPATIQAGDEITLTGANLDLVTGITVGGKAGSITSQSETEVKATTPMDASIAGTGVEVLLTLANGVSVPTAINVTFPAYCFILELPAADVEIKAGELLRLAVENSSRLTGVQVNSAPTQYILQGATLYVLIPGSAGGQAVLKLVSSNGEATYPIDVVGTGPVETVIFQGPVDLTWSDGGRAIVPASELENVAAGTVMKIYFAQKEAWGQAQINNGSWTVIPFAELGDNGYLTTNTYEDKSASEQELVLTQDVLDNIRTSASDGNGIIIQGSDWIITKITLITGGGGGGGVESVADPTMVFFPFIDPATEYSNEGLGSGAWKELGGVVASGAGAPSEWIYKVDEDVDGSWKIYFANNGQWINDANPFNSGNLTANSTVKMDIKIDAIGSDVVLKFRLKGTGGDFWYVWSVGALYPTGTDWTTVTFPLADFRDGDGNGTGTLDDPAAQLAHTAGQNDVEYGLTAGWGAGHITMSIDNVRFK